MKEKRIILMLLGLLICSAGFAEEAVHREPIEWCDIWVKSANLTDQPRVLFVGDSITKAYYNQVEKELEGVAYCAKMATSSCIADPAFHLQLEFLLSQYHWDVFHFNNGLHGSPYSDAEYEVGYRKALETIQRHAPKAKVILTLSTPLQSHCEEEAPDSMVGRRNQIVKAFAEKYGFEIDNLYSISMGHPEYYKDLYHYKPEAVALQSAQVVSVIKKALQDKE